MAPAFGAAPTLAKLRERLIELGCDIKDLSGHIGGPHGEYRVWYAYNPKNGKYVTLPLLHDDDLVGQYTVANIERRLDLKTGFPTA